MTTTTSHSHKKLGIWMDHSIAHLIEFTNGSIEPKTIMSKFTHDVKIHSLHQSEHVMHNKEQQQQAEYYGKIGEVINNYGEVILFGPTDAKTELFNILESNRNFEKIKIVVKQTDKMTENQQHAFVNDYFKNK